jgi:hypothetical protein
MAKFKDLSLDLETGEHIDFDDADTIMMGYDGNELYISSTVSGVRAAQPHQMVRYDQLTESSGTLQDQIDDLALDIEGQDEFIELVDTPVTYSGQGGYVVSVLDNELGLEFIPAAPAVLVSGTSPPDESNIWFNSNDNIIYYYDPARGKWLSTNIINYLFTYSANIDGLYLSVGNVVSSYAHYNIVRDATIVSISAEQDPGSSAVNKGYEIHDTAVSIYNFSMAPHSYTNNNLNVDIDTDANLQMFCVAAGAKSRDPIINLELRWRYDIV